MTINRTKSELIFENLLNERDYPFFPESDIWQKIGLDKKTYEKQKKPDYYFETPFGNVFAEIKEFQNPSKLDDNFNLGTHERNGYKISLGYSALSEEELRKPFKDHIRSAAHKFHLYSYEKKPCILVFDNCNNITIDSHFYIMMLNFGNSGSLRIDHYNDISAISFNENDYNNSDSTLKLRIIHNPFANIKLPLDIFNNLNDEHFIYMNNDWHIIKNGLKQTTFHYYNE